MLLEEYLHSMGVNYNDDEILKNGASEYDYSYGDYGIYRETGRNLCLKFDDGTVTDKYGNDENGEFTGYITPFNDDHLLDEEKTDDSEKEVFYVSEDDCDEKSSDDEDQDAHDYFEFWTKDM